MEAPKEADLAFIKDTELTIVVKIRGTGSEDQSTYRSENFLAQSILVHEIFTLVKSDV